MELSPAGQMRPTKTWFSYNQKLGTSCRSCGLALILFCWKAIYKQLLLLPIYINMHMIDPAFMWWIHISKTTISIDTEVIWSTESFFNPSIIYSIKNAYNVLSVLPRRKLEITWGFSYKSAQLCNNLNSLKVFVSLEILKSVRNYFHSLKEKFNLQDLIIRELHA